MTRVLTIALLAALMAPAEDLSRIASLNGAARRKALRALLLSKPDDPLQFINSAFYHERRLRPSLRALLRDPQVSEAAQSVLAIIGVPEDVQLIIRLAPPPGRAGFEDEWAYGVACTLVEPRSELEWAFLRKAALNEYNDRWAERGAIQTLKLLASPRSRRLLEEALIQNKDRTKPIARALEYIDSSPSPLVDRNLEELARRVAQAIQIGKWEGNEPPRYNQTRNKALIDIGFVAGRNSLTYTATFHKSHGVWRLRGVRETLQSLLPPSPP